MELYNPTVEIKSWLTPLQPSNLSWLLAAPVMTWPKWRNGDATVTLRPYSWVWVKLTNFQYKWFKTIGVSWRQGVRKAAFFFLQIAVTQLDGSLDIWRSLIQRQPFKKGHVLMIPKRSRLQNCQEWKEHFGERIACFFTTGQRPGKETTDCLASIDDKKSGWQKHNHSPNAPWDWYIYLLNFHQKNI